MAEELDELLDFLSSPSPNVSISFCSGMSIDVCCEYCSNLEQLRKAAVEIVEGLTGSDDGIQKLMSRITTLIVPLLRLLAENKVVGGSAARSLVNLSQDEDVSEKLIERYAIEKAMELLGKQGQEIDKLLLMLLVNLTTLEQGSRQLIQEKDGSHLRRLIMLSSKPDEAYDDIAAILVNITRVDTGRKLLLSDGKRSLLEKILLQQNSESLARRRGIVSTLRNCCFEAESDISSLLSFSDLIWPCLLLPVAGAKIYSEEERSKMPPDLSTPLSFEREAEKDKQLRMEALDAICLIITQEAGFRAFWQISGPEILRGGYEDEEDPQLMGKYEQLGALVLSRSEN